MDVKVDVIPLVHLFFWLVFCRKYTVGGLVEREGNGVLLREKIYTRAELYFVG